MLGSNPNIFNPVNGEQHVKGLISAAFDPRVKHAFRLVGYGHIWNASNKPSEHNIMAIPMTQTKYVAAGQKFSYYHPKMISRNVIFPQ